MDLWFFNTPAPPAHARLAYGSVPHQFAELSLPQDSPGPYPIIIVIHGGFRRSRFDLEFMSH